MYQKAGSGAQISPTISIDEVTRRFKEFPSIALTSAAAYETEVATYDTIPLPTPTAEEQEDFLLALRDGREKKLQYIQARNDLQFAFNNPMFFQNLPSNDALRTAIDGYTKLINAVMDHLIKLSRGQTTPVRLFDPSSLGLKEPERISLQRAEPPAAPLVPNLIGQRIETASSELMQLGLVADPKPKDVVETMMRSLERQGKPMNVVFAQDPPPGTRTNPGARVQYSYYSYTPSTRPRPPGTPIAALGHTRPR
jgi:hypothetical protein